MFVGHFGVGFAGKAAAPARLARHALPRGRSSSTSSGRRSSSLGLEKVEIRPGITRVTPLDFVSYPISHSPPRGRHLGAPLRRGLPAGAEVRGRGGDDVRRRRQPLAPRPPDPSPRPAALARERREGRPRPLELAPRDGRRRARDLRRRASRSTSGRRRPLDRTGSIGLWGLVGFLLLVYAANLFGSTPPGVEAIAWAGPRAVAPRRLGVLGRPPPDLSVARPSPA